MISAIKKDITDITTDDLRIYLDTYQRNSGVSRVTIDNIRRILSSFFAWLEDEDYIQKSPVRRIHKVKTCKTVKETYSDEALELMRDHSECIRDLAIIDMLASTGMRVGELVKLNKNDVNFESREYVIGLPVSIKSFRLVVLPESNRDCISSINCDWFNLYIFYGMPLHYSD